MVKYVLKRILWMIFIVLAVAFVIFTVTYLTPGDPAQLLLGDNATKEEVEALRATLGLDKSYFAQLGEFYYKTFIKFDFGTSWYYKVSVTDEMITRLPRTVGMGLASIILANLIGIPLGIKAARKRGKWQDYGVIGASMVLVSLPGFWVAIIFVIIFAFTLNILPSHGIGGIQYYIIPVVVSAIGAAATTARQTRSAMLEVINADFVYTVRAKGQKENIIVRKHIIPNGIMPIITMMGNQCATVVAGSTIMERVFSIPGVGLYLLNGVSYRDYPIIRTTTLFFAIFSAVIILLVDLVYAWLDPRIKAQYSKGRR
ncbi:MAG: ABC transporter permease [Lachnospiraceae bacterium]|nr:ABC transporter permease [Lachnospiraceae bacterium]